MLIWSEWLLQRRESNNWQKIRKNDFTTSAGQVGRPAIRFFGQGVTKDNKEDPDTGYLSPGNIDITANVNFRPYIYNAAFQQLFIHYGSQVDILGEFAIRNVLMAMIEEKYSHVRSANELRELHNSIKEINNFGRIFFAVLTATPDIALPTVHKSGLPVWGMLPFEKISLPWLKPNTEYTIYSVVKGKRTTSCKETSDNEGRIGLPPSIFLEKGQIVENTASGEQTFQIKS